MLRLFVVGCPRAGTTLLQSVLLSSESIISFPESHFFLALGKSSRRTPPGIYGRRLVNNWLDQTNIQYQRKIWIGLSRNAAIKYFWNTLDDIASTQSMKGWLEKTPGHVHHIELIQKSIPDAKFIHIIRSHKENIASLYLARKKWGDECPAITTARNWFGHLSKSLWYLNHENHCHISYDELISNPGHVIKQLSAFTNLPLPEPENVDYSIHAKKIVEKHSTWKSNNLESTGIAATRSKFESTFTDIEKKEIEDYIKSIKNWINISFGSK